MADRVRVKICGLMRREDARVADAAGSDYLGVVLSSGFSRSVAASEAAAILDGTAARKVAVLVGETAEAAEALAGALGADVIQLHGEEDPSVIEELHRRGPWKLWKAVRARSLDDVRAAVELYRDVADGILVEGWKKGVTGGGGARLALEPGPLRGLIPGDLDFVLAGGLGPETVGEAVALHRPTVVDVSSGVERRVGEKEPSLVRAFVEAARAATRPTEKDKAS